MLVVGLGDRTHLTWEPWFFPARYILNHGHPEVDVLLDAVESFWHDTAPTVHGEGATGSLVITLCELHTCTHTNMLACAWVRTLRACDLSRTAPW